MSETRSLYASTICANSHEWSWKIQVKFTEHKGYTVQVKTYVCMYVFYGAYNYSGLVRQISEFSTVSVKVKMLMGLSKILSG